MASRTAPWFKPAPTPSNWDVRAASTGYAPGTTWGTNPMGGYSFNPPKVQPPSPAQWQPQPTLPWQMGQPGRGISTGSAFLGGQRLPVQTGLTNLPPGIGPGDQFKFGGATTIGQPPGPPVGDIPGQSEDKVDDEELTQKPPPKLPTTPTTTPPEDIGPEPTTPPPPGYHWAPVSTWVDDPNTGPRRVHAWTLQADKPGPPEPTGFEFYQQTGKQPWAYPGATKQLAWDAQGRAFEGYYDTQGNFIGYGLPMGGTVPGKTPEQPKTLDKVIDPSKTKDVQGPVGTDTVERQYFNKDGQLVDSKTFNVKIKTPEVPPNPNWVTVKRGWESSDMPGSPGSTGKWQQEYLYQQGSIYDPVAKQWKTVEQKVPVAGTGQPFQNWWGRPEDLARLELERGHEAQSKKLNEDFGFGAATAARNMYNLQQPQNWIQRQLALGQTPATPPELGNIIGQQAGTPLQRKSVPFLSLNQWQAMTPAIKQQLMGYLQWIDIDPNQWIQDMQDLWQSVRPTPGVRWGIIRQR